MNIWHGCDVCKGEDTDENPVEPCDDCGLSHHAGCSPGEYCLD